MNNNIKNNLIHSITQILAIFSILSLLFPLVKIEVDANIPLLGKIMTNMNINGFDFITGFSSIFDHDWRSVLTGFVCLLQLVFSAILIIVNLLIVSINDEDIIKKFSIVSIVICTLFLVLFVVSGFLLIYDIKSMLVGKIENIDLTSVKISSLSYIPLIIDAVLIFAFVLVNIVNQED